MTIPVRIARHTDLPAVARVMDRAFRNDPSVDFVLGDIPGGFEREHHLYVALCAAPAFDSDGVHLMADGTGAAIWYPPGVGVSDAAWEAFVAKAVNPARLAALGAQAALCDAYRPETDHWTLELIGIDPSAQGQGVGRVLMARGLAQADAAECPVFLASSNPANLSFYTRLGFALLAEVRSGDVPPVFAMVRPAQGRP